MARIRVREEALQALRARRRLGTDRALANAMGVNHVVIVRLKAGKQPGEVALRGFVTAFPRARLGDLFEIVEDEIADAA